MFLFPLSLIWSCVSLTIFLTDPLVSLCPFFPVSVSHYLLALFFLPLRTESSSLLIQVKSVSGPTKWPLFPVPGDSEFGGGHGQGISSLLPMQLALAPARPSTNSGLTHRVLEPSPSNTHIAPSLVRLLLSWASLLPLLPSCPCPVTPTPRPGIPCYSAQTWSPAEARPLGERKMGELRGRGHPGE